MQPYLFPYLGYFQLARAVDQFWLLDTVSFIQGGWMNRNALRAGDGRGLFTLPMAAGPHDAPIRDRAYHPKAGQALAKLHRRVAESYARTPHRDRALALVEEVAAAFDRTGPDFTGLTAFALARTFAALGIATPIRRISELDLPAGLAGQDRIVAACQAIGARDYLNMEGGRALYDARTFARAGISLSFLTPDLPPYDQSGADFLPGLSILDAIAHVAPQDLSVLVQAGRIAAARP